MTLVSSHMAAPAKRSQDTTKALKATMQASDQPTPEPELSTTSKKFPSVIWPLCDPDKTPITVPPMPPGMSEATPPSGIHNNSASTPRPLRTQGNHQMLHAKPITQPWLKVSAVSISLVPDENDSTTRFCSRSCNVSTGPKVAPSALLGMHKMLACSCTQEDFELLHADINLLRLRLLQPSGLAEPSLNYDPAMLLIQRNAAKS